MWKSNAHDPWVCGPELTGVPCPHEWTKVRLCDKWLRPNSYYSVTSGQSLYVIEKHDNPLQVIKQNKISGANPRSSVGWTKHLSLHVVKQTY